MAQWQSVRLEIDGPSDRDSLLCVFEQTFPLLSTGSTKTGKCADMTEKLLTGM